MAPEAHVGNGAWPQDDDTRTETNIDYAGAATLSRVCASLPSHSVSYMKPGQGIGVCDTARNAGKWSPPYSVAFHSGDGCGPGARRGLAPWTVTGVFIGSRFPPLPPPPDGKESHPRCALRTRAAFALLPSGSFQHLGQRLARAEWAEAARLEIQLIIPCSCLYSGYCCASGLWKREGGRRLCETASLPSSRGQVKMRPKTKAERGTCCVPVIRDARMDKWNSPHSEGGSLRAQLESHLGSRRLLSADFVPGNVLSAGNSRQACPRGAPNLMGETTCTQPCVY
ncbi:uncharacterized protein LOC114028050 [Vombatus ursinus]|uniref:uncharacterized protein LOC114028050 n=1 Tax=Vombatus ursinus TaxID=29139 RepID=UPI000FFD25FD|nr:uncharacterized protein LOC114028050 [Vombatus ursinus]